MPDTLTTISNFINSPPCQLVAGATLGGIVWKFFERVESAITDATKHDIARWLRIKNIEVTLISEPIVPWHQTFAGIFDRVFGTTHLTLRCFVRSSIASTLVGLGAWTFFGAFIVCLDSGCYFYFPTEVFLLIVFINILPDYLSLLKSRYLLGLMSRTQLVWLWLTLVIVDLLFTFIIAAVLVLAVGVPELQVATQQVMKNTWPFSVTFRAFLLGMWEGVDIFIRYCQDWLGLQILWNDVTNDKHRLFVYPAFFTSVWLWLYAGSGFLLRAARRFDLGFQWFNRKFDIEKKPLQCIGLVAGALVALAYWAAVIVSRVR